MESLHEKIRYRDGLIAYFIQPLLMIEKPSESKEVSVKLKNKLVCLHRKYPCFDPKSNYEWWA